MSSEVATSEAVADNVASSAAARWGKSAVAATAGSVVVTACCKIILRLADPSSSASVQERRDSIICASMALSSSRPHIAAVLGQLIYRPNNGTDTDIFRPLPHVAKEADLLFVGRTEDRKKGIGTMLGL